MSSTSQPSHLDRSLAALKRLEGKLRSMESARTEPIAIVGLGCRTPGGARDPESLWQLLVQGVDAVREVPTDRWPAGLTPEATEAERQSIRWAGTLESVDGFDAAFFGVSPREAMYLDPQQRLVLEVAWESLENAGIPADNLMGSRTGVFLGICSTDYREQALLQESGGLEGYTLTGNMLSTAAGRLSYVLGLQGPCISVDTACSSSLVAVHLACQSLRQGESGLALAGGVHLLLSPYNSYMLARLQALSPDGRCRTFDSHANGFVRAEGCGFLVLKRLSDAQRDGDRIWALIRGSAVNQDGRSTGLTAPNVLSQQQLLRQALENARVSPTQLSYVEAHGTGTSLGDPIEVEALKEVLGQPRPDGSVCLLGSVKTNLGHLEAAAGVAGLLKVVLALKHELLPRQLHFNALNPRISLEGSPLAIAVESKPWKRGAAPRLAGVSAFGLSGTNAHVVVEEAPAQVGAVAQEEAGTAVLLPLSARSQEGLRALAGAYREHLQGGEGRRLRDMAYTASVRRSHHAHRVAVVGRTREELAEGLGEFLRGEEERPAVGEVAPKVVFVFSGQGSQWVGMGRELLAQQPVFREALEECESALKPYTSWSPLEQLAAAEDEARLGEVEVVQPLLFCMQVALARLWRHWGVKPAAVVGHSMGEVAAAHVAGALSLREAARVIAMRSQLVRQHASGRGAMAVVELSLEEAEHAVGEWEGRLAVGASNGPRTSVLSGESGALEQVLARLEQAGVYFRRVQVDYASHSPQMEGLKPLVRGALEGLRPKRCEVPFYSTVEVGWLEGEGLGAEYWAENLRRPVRFAQAVRGLRESGHEIFLELSPHPVLVPDMEEGLRQVGNGGRAVGTLRRGEESASLMRAAGALYEWGQVLEFGKLYPGGGRVVSLPSYPWQRERYWVEGNGRQERGRGRRPAGAHPLLGESVQPSTQPGTRLWEVELSPEAQPYLADHRVQGAVVVPAAAYIEMVLAAAREAHGGEQQELEGVAFQQALVLAEDEVKRAQVVLVEQGPGEVAFQVNSLQGEGSAAAWVQHVRGVVKRGAPEAGESVAGELEEVRRAGEVLEMEACYQELERRGLGYGTAFRAVRQAWRKGMDVVGRVELQESEQAGAYGVHPALLDAALQMLLLAWLGRGSEQGAVVLVHAGRVRLYRRVGHEVWSQGRLKEAGEGRGGEWEGELRLVDGEGRVLMEVEGLRLQALEKGGAQRREREALLLAREWQRAEVTRKQAEGPGKWLVLAQEQGLAEQVSALLEKRGESVARRAMEATTAQGYGTLLREVFGGEGCRGVVYVCGREEPREQEWVEGSVSVLHLVQALVGTGWRNMPRLWLVTRGAQAVGSHALSQAAGLFQTPLWGLGQVVTYEHPELRCSRVDLSPLEPAEQAAALVEELLAASSEEQVALRPEGRYVARLRRGLPAATQQPERLVKAQGQPFQLRTQAPGALERLKLERVERRPPQAGEVEVEVEATGLNFRDVLLALGALPAEGPEGPLLGYECAGRVVAVGAGVQHLQVGQQVVALAAGSLGTHVVVDASVVLPRPAHVKAEQAAGIPLAYVTAYYSLEHVARLRRGERVLVHAASGGVGLAAVQWAMHVGAEVYATAGSELKREYLRGLGVKYVGDSRTLGFVEQVRGWTGGEGVDVVLNSLSGEFIPRSLELLKEGGRFVELGARDALANSALGLKPFLRNLTFSLVELRRLWKQEPRRVGALLQEVLKLVEQGVLAPPTPRVWPVSQVQEAFHEMAQGRHIGKQVVALQDEAAMVVEGAAEGTRQRWEGTYLISGGLGGLGPELAKWLVGKGVKHLALVSRGGVKTPQQAQALEELRARGASVEVVQVDVADKQALRQALEELEGRMPPLRGVVHAAAVLDDGLLEKQSRERFERVMRPKVLGAWNLHELTEGRRLECFVLYSSMVSLVGSPGLGNYAAANAFLDGLAHYRRSRGLPGVSINWGAFAEVGMAVAEEKRGARMEQRGMGLMKIAQGHAALEKLFDGALVAQIAVAKMDVRQWAEFYPHAGASPYLSKLVHQAARVEGAEEGRRTRQALQETAPERRRELLEHYIREQVAQVLRLEPERIDRNTPLKSLGIDSLMGLELRNRLETKLALTLPATLIWAYPYVAVLTEHIASRLGILLEEENTLPATPAASSAPAEQVLTIEKVVTLSEAEKEELLRKTLEALEIPES